MHPTPALVLCTDNGDGDVGGNAVVATQDNSPESAKQNFLVVE
jgi:hypothetical protein